MKYRVDKKGYFVKPVDLVGVQASVEDADVNAGVEDNFFLNRYISSNSKVPASLKVASAN